VAVLIRGPAPDAAITVRGVRATAGHHPHTVYLVLDDSAPAEALNRTAAVRTENLLLILDAGLTPTAPNWLAAMATAVAACGVGAAVGTRVGGAGPPVAGLLTKRGVFDLLGGFDADRFAHSGYVEDYLARLIGLGSECVAPAAATFRIVPPVPLERAG
jgi:hypothetical protein